MMRDINVTVMSDEANPTCAQCGEEMFDGQEAFADDTGSLYCVVCADKMGYQF